MPVVEEEFAREPFNDLRLKKQTETAI